MSTRSAKHVIEGLLADLIARRAELEEQTKAVDRDIGSTERTLTLLTDALENPSDTGELGNPITADTISDCETQRAALYRIAEMNGGIVRATEAGVLILEAGLSDAKKASVIATVHKFMSQSDDWEWTEPGSFRLKTYEEPEPSGYGRYGYYYSGNSETGVDDLPF